MRRRSGRCSWGRPGRFPWIGPGAADFSSGDRSSTRCSTCTMTEATHRRICVATAVAVALFAVIVHERASRTHAGAVILSNLGQCLAPALAALGCVLASPPGHHLGALAWRWKLLGASALSWSLGQVAWTYYEVSGCGGPVPVARRRRLPVGGPARAGGACGSMSVRAGTSSLLVAVLDGLIIAGGLLAISWPLVLGPELGCRRRQPAPVRADPGLPVGNLDRRLDRAAGDHADRSQPRCRSARARSPAA